LAAPDVLAYWFLIGAAGAGTRSRGGLLPKANKSKTVKFLGLDLDPETMSVIPPPGPDVSQMSDAELIEYTLATYTNLQRIWRMELLILPQPDWEIVEEVSRQMSMLEEGLEGLVCS
jgi:hypothetical protein